MYYKFKCPFCGHDSCVAHKVKTIEIETLTSVIVLPDGPDGPPDGNIVFDKYAGGVTDNSLSGWTTDDNVVSEEPETIVCPSCGRTFSSLKAAIEEGAFYEVTKGDVFDYHENN